MQTPDDAPAGTSDWERLRSFLSQIDDHGFIALPPDRGRVTQSDQHEDLAQEALQRGLSAGEWSGLGWHAQSSERAFRDKKLVAPLAVHWVGNHATVAAKLALLDEAYVVHNDGAESAFFIAPPTRPPTEALPDVADGEAVAERLDRYENEPEIVGEPTLAWVVDVIARADPSSALRALRLVELTEPAVLDAVVPRWVELTKSDGFSELPRDVLLALHESGDPRLDDLLAQATTSRSAPLRWGAAVAWTRIGGAPAQRHLDKFARAKPKPVPTAVEGWIEVTARLTDRQIEAVALDLAVDESRTDQARRSAFECACYAKYPEPAPFRVLHGALDLLEDTARPEPVRRFAFDRAATGGDWRSGRAEHDAQRRALHQRLLPWLDEYGADLHPATLDWHRTLYADD